jgi:hypothetical protein
MMLGFGGKSLSGPIPKLLRVGVALSQVGIHAPFQLTVRLRAAEIDLLLY